MMAKESQPGSLFVVAKVDISLKRGFIAEDFIVVSLIWPISDVERGIQVHPRHVTFKIVIGGKGVGACVEKFFQAGVVGKGGSVPQQLRRASKIAAVLRAIGNKLELMLCITPDYVEESFSQVLRLRIKGLDPALKFFLGHVWRIEVCCCRFSLWDAREESLVLINLRPWALVDPEVMQPCVS